MALEAGELLHKVFAAVRLWQLDRIQKLPQHAAYNGGRIFGKGAWGRMWNHCVTHTDERDQLMELCFAVLAAGGWKDMETDRTRTMTNMELATIEYINERLPGMENWPIYVEDLGNPQSMVGIEQVFDVVLTFEDNFEIRYIGTVDGLVQKQATLEYYVDENKTSVRLSQAWRDSHEMRGQNTGYCAISTALFKFRVLKCRVTGLKIPPTHRGEDVLTFEIIERTEDAIQHWATWVREMVETFIKYKDDFEHATRFTHSCYRFFRTCSLLSFCADNAEGRKIAFHEQMVHADLSPSERAVVE